MFEVPPELAIDPQAVSARLESFIGESVRRLEKDGIVVGLSGGIDSAVAGTLAVRALGREKVLALLLPERDTDPQSTRDGRAMAETLGIRCREINLTAAMAALGIYRLLPLWAVPFWGLRRIVVQRMLSRFRGEAGTSFLESREGRQGAYVRAGGAYGRAKPRVRMVELYLQADKENLLVLGTDNKTEFMIGLFARWGDSVSDAAPLAGFFKTEIRQLARYLEVPAHIIEKAPSPDVLPGVTDEDVLGIDYTRLDRILWRLERGMDTEAIARETGVEPGTIRRVEKMVERAAPLRGAPLEPPREAQE